ncbi:hypothetical protein BDR07DRAFT_1485650 [Suillus spraguei]|nr:hypothetical protein BDR07DRAFT_1485650 [Suillus spraguei]
MAIKDHMAKESSILDGHLHKLILSKVLLYALQTKHIENILAVLRDDSSIPQKRMITYYKLANPIQRAIWPRAIQVDGNFADPASFTPDLAKFKYLSNTTLLLEVLLDKDKNTNSVHVDDYDHIARIYQCALYHSPPTTFNFLYEMQKFTSSLAFNQTKEPNIYIDPNVEYITISTQIH